MTIQAAGDKRREWAVWLSPQRLAGTTEGVVFAGVCIFALVLIYLGDLRTHQITVSAFEFMPVLAAGWLLGPRLTITVGVSAILIRIIAGYTGVPPLTAAAQALTVPMVAVISRLAAINVGAARASAARAHLVSRVARIATSADTLPEILDRVLREMADAGLPGAAIALIDERNELYIAASEIEMDEAMRAARLPVGQGIMGTAAARGTSTLVADVEAPDAPPAANRDIATNARVRSIMVSPLRSAGTVIGVIEVDSSRPRAFAEDDLAVLEQIALAISGAVQRAGALQLADMRLQRRVRELTLLLQTARALASSLDLDVVITEVCRSALQVALSAELSELHGALYRIDGTRAVIVAEYDPKGGTTPSLPELPVASHPGIARAVKGGKLVTVKLDQLKPPATELRDRVGLKVSACAPIRAGHDFQGVLVVSSRQSHVFDDTEVRLLEGIANLAGLAIGNAQALTLERNRSQQLREHGERMAALDKAKGDFLRLASHELRTPLGVIKGYISMLEEGSLGGLPDTAIAVMPTLLTKVAEMHLLIDQMLETARMEDERMQLTRERCDLRTVLRDAVTAMEPSASENHRLVLEVPATPVRVSGDVGRLGTILRNLIDNAIKYSPAGGDVKCRVSVDDGLAAVSITDEGLGIDEADMPKLFTRFGRIVTADNSNIQGTGLGLYISRELARMHGGDIQAVSRVHEGSTFTLRLPVAATRGAARPSAAKAAPSGRTRRTA